MNDYPGPDYWFLSPPNPYPHSHYPIALRFVLPLPSEELKPGSEYLPPHGVGREYGTN